MSLHRAGRNRGSSEVWLSRELGIYFGGGCRMRFLRTILFVAYIVIGIIVAADHHYFVHLGSVKSIVSAVLAVALWPLILFGVNLHIK
jgi:hypothetical protein